MGRSRSRTVSQLHVTVFLSGLDPHDAFMPPGQLPTQTRHGGDFRVLPGGIVVKKDQSLDAGLEGEFERGLIIGMAPAPPFLDLLRRVLGIMDEDIRVSAKGHVLLGGASGPSVRSQFVVGDKDQAPLSFPNPKPEAPLWMLQRNTVYQGVTDLERTPVEAIEVVDLGLQIVKLNREKPITHLVVKGISEALHTGMKTVDQDPARGFVNRGEKRKTEDVIPMDMRDQEVDINPFSRSRQLLTQGPDTGAGVDDHLAPASEIDFQTGGIAPVQGRILARDRNRTSGSPKCYSHDDVSMSSSERCLGGGHVGSPLKRT